MDEAVARSMARWPNVPAVHGWLKLDARGEWRLRNPATGAFERIANPALRAFIGRNYADDGQGRWHFQNGPQRVYVALEVTPWVFRLAAARLEDHRGLESGKVRGAWIDESGALVLLTARGVGVLDDRDLLAAIACLCDAGGAPLAEPCLERLVDGAPIADAFLRLPRQPQVKLGRIRRDELPGRFGFERDPVSE